MKIKTFVMALVLCFAFTAVSFAAEAAKETGEKTGKAFWKKVVNYPAKVTEESVSTVAETGKSGTKVVTTEVKRIGEVTSGDVAKTKEMVTEPLTGTAQTAVTAVEDTAKIPVEAAKE